MREIKFRERLKNGFHFWGFIDGGFIGPTTPLNHSDEFTGLKDKNGKEIYEGDIYTQITYRCAISLPSNSGGTTQGERIKETVEFKHGSFNVPYDISFFDVEVIGNIYENPELLRGV